MRERLILQAISMEMEAERGMRRIAVEAAWSSCYSPQGAQAVHQAGNQGWRQYASLMELTVSAQTKTKAIDKPAETLLKVFEALESSGLLEQIRLRDINLADELTD